MTKPIEIRPGMTVLPSFTPNQDGRPILCGLTIEADAITPDDLRRISVTMLERSAELTPDNTPSDELPRPDRSVHNSETFAGLVAAHYRVLACRYPHPGTAMAKQWNVKLPTVHTWIREARLRGLLPPAKRRKAAS